MKPKLHTYITTKLPLIKQNILYDAANNCLKDNDIDIKDNPGEICFILNIGTYIIGMLILSRKILAVAVLVRKIFGLENWHGTARSRSRAENAKTMYNKSKLIIENKMIVFNQIKWWIQNHFSILKL